MGIAKYIILSALLLGAILLASCTKAPESSQEERALAEPKAPTPPPAPPIVISNAIPEQWRKLAIRLAEDKIAGPDIDDFFMRIGDTPTQDPMGRKVKELYTKNFIRKPIDPNAPKIPKPQFYKNVITDENAAKCREFLTQYADSFNKLEARYAVPKEIAVSLMFVETRLGTSLGAERAAYTLASMSQSRTPQSIELWLPQLPGYEEHLDWMTELMPKRADWAYKELRALLLHARANNLDPLSMPGSIYGAIGICQFMPSNLVAYTADGDDDGVINLFNVPDAIASLSNYLVKHGWRANIDRQIQHSLLKRYNNADVYANTILALSDKVAGKDLPLPKPAKKQPKKKKEVVKKAQVVAGKN